MPELMTTGEVAAFLRVKERTVYELVRTRRIPCSRATGRLLFPKALIQAWVRSQVSYEGPRLDPPPPVLAGSHDPLLEWAVRESGCDLALLSGGSTDGLRRLELGEAVAAALHLFDGGSGEYNAPFLRQSVRSRELALIHWAWREQGLITAPRNPKKIRTVADLARRGVVLACRQEGAGSQLLLRHLLQEAGMAWSDLSLLQPAMRTEMDVAAAVLDGQADCGLGVAAAARRHRLGFVPLQRERFDIGVTSIGFFQEGMQRLLWFTRNSAFPSHAAALGGYDVSETGRVIVPPG